jgi:adenylate cyclase
VPADSINTANAQPDLLLGFIAKLRERFTESSKELSEQSRDDFVHLFKGADKLLVEVEASEEGYSGHDLMNALAAVQGYAELLHEDAGNFSDNLSTLLSQLLGEINAVQGLGVDNHQPDKRVINCEPGFILAVDDLQENRELVARNLSRAGHFVVTASSGEEALKTLAETDVDVVLLDLFMPDMDGHEVLQKIKANPDWRATPVIMISGQQDMQGIIDCIEAGADDYLLKPFNPVLLQARIKAGIERKRWHDREQQYRQQLERNEKFIRATFGRYLSDEIVTDILERPEGLELGGDLREVTIMMSDIRGFTTLCEALAPAQVVKILNRYLGAMTDIIMAHQGTIDEFIGDAILAVFGAPQRRDDDADRAVSCALAMQEAMADINAKNIADGMPEISMGIALNTGDVIAGNIGSKRRSKYGFVGHPMNLTSRIEEFTAGGELLVSDSTLKKLTRDYNLGRSEEHKVKGIDAPVLIHHILEPK